MLFLDKALETIRSVLPEVHEHLEAAEDRITQWQEALRQLSSNVPLYREWASQHASIRGSVPMETSWGSSFVKTSDLDFNSLEDQRSWAEQVLEGVTTAAVDGSHMDASDILDLGLGVVQVAWFVNRHHRGGDYEKHVNVQVVFDGDLRSDQPRSAFYQLTRFEAEMAKAKELVCSLQGTAPLPPVVFIDGTLIPSFAELATPEVRQGYVAPVVELLEASERYRVPVVAYIDRSWARDVLDALATLLGLQPKAPPVSDAETFNSLLAQLGARTIAFGCRRRGILQSFTFRGRDYSTGVAFVYMRVNSSLPVRIEFPSWVVDEAEAVAPANSNLVDYIAQITLAEAIVGDGYPWPLASADAAAALTAKDRAFFLELLQREMANWGIELLPTRKTVSKYQRRIW